MQPNQPLPPSAAPPSNFDFILNNTPKKSRIPSLGGGGLKQRILIVLFGVLGLIILLVIVSSLLSGGGKGNTQTLIDIAGQQTELIRIADLGYPNTSSNLSKNLATTTSTSTKSALQSVTAILKKKGKKVTTKQLSIKKNTKTDTAFTTAEQSNQFDQTFNQTMLASLATYRTSLKQAYNGSSGKTEKQTLADIYNGVDLLITSQTAPTTTP